MDSENNPQIDLNLADEETLTQLRGVGSRLARRIIAERPFEQIEDLVRVRGISDKDVDRLRPYLTISTEEVESEAAEIEEMPVVTADDGPEIEETEAEEIPEPTEEVSDILEEEAKIGTVASEDEIEEGATPLPEIEPDSDAEVDAMLEEETALEPEAEPVADDDIFEPVPQAEEEKTEEEPLPEEIEPDAERPVEPAPASPGYITRGRAIGLVFFSCFLTVILAVVITLGILSTLNRGQLNYATPSQVATLQTQLNGLALQTETLTSDLDGLRTRLDNLEALSGRVNDLENEITTLYVEMDTLQADIDATQAKYDELESQLETFDAELETLKTQSSRFESFLEGLRDLMLGLFPETQE